MFTNAALVALGLLVVLNLFLTFGVIRRLREHTEQLKRVQSGPEAVLAQKGTKVADFAATTTDGEALSAASLTGEIVMGFFSPGCGPCETLLPTFVEYAAKMPGGRAQVVAVIATNDLADPLVPEKVAALSPYARTLVDRYDGEVLKAFGVDAYPAVYLLHDRTVEASGRDLRVLPARVGA